MCRILYSILSNVQHLVQDPIKWVGSCTGSYQMCRVLYRILSNVQDLVQDPMKYVGSYTGSYQMCRILDRILSNVQDLAHDPIKCVGSCTGSYQMCRILHRILSNVQDLVQDPIKCVGSCTGSYQMCGILYRILSNVQDLEFVQDPTIQLINIRILFIFCLSKFVDLLFISWEIHVICLGSYKGSCISSIYFFSIVRLVLDFLFSGQTLQCFLSSSLYAQHAAHALIGKKPRA